MFKSIIQRFREWNFRRKYFDKKNNAWLPIKLKAVGDVQRGTSVHYAPKTGQWTIVDADGVVTHYANAWNNREVIGE